MTAGMVRRVQSAVDSSRRTTALRDRGETSAGSAAEATVEIIADMVEIIVATLVVVDGVAEVGVFMVEVIEAVLEVGMEVVVGDHCQSIYLLFHSLIECYISFKICDYIIRFIGLKLLLTITFV